MPALLRSRRSLLWVLGALVALALLLLSHPAGRQPVTDQGLAMGVVDGRMLPVPPGLKAPHSVRVALRLEDLRGLDLSTKTFKARQLVRFVNQVESWNSLFEPTGPVQAPGRGWFSQSFRFEGLFYVNAFDLHSAPFLNISLPLILEVGDDRLALEADGVLQLDYRTDGVAAALRWILPMLLVMAVVLLAPSLDSGRDDLSFSLPSAGLLTLVVLQEGYENQVPSTPYLTFLDQLYAYSYGVILLGHALR